MTPEQQLIQQIIQLINSSQLERNPLLEDYAEQFSEMCRLANDRLLRCADYLDKGMRSEAIHEAQTQPDLFHLSELLASDGLRKWKNICIDLELARFQPLNESILTRLRSEMKLEEDLSPLLKEYRRCVYQADHPGCIRILRQLREKDPENQSWKTNLEPLEEAALGEWIEQAEEALSAMDLRWLKSIFNELNHPQRVVAAPESLMKRLRVALMSERSGDLLLEGEKLLGIVRDLMSKEDAVELEAQLEKCDKLMEDEAFLRRPPEWDKTLVSARELLETLGRRRAKQADFNQAMSGMRDLLEGGSFGEMELRHEWERLEAWEMPIPELLRRQVEETLGAMRSRRLRRAKMIAYGTACGIILAVLVAFGVLWWHNRNVLRARRLAEMEALYDGKRIDELENYLKLVEESDPVFFKSPAVRTLNDKLLANKETFRKMALEYANRRTYLEGIRKNGYGAGREQIERLLREADENATSREEKDWLSSWRNGWRAWESRQVASADGVLARAIRQIDTSLVELRGVDLVGERKKLEELRDICQKAQVVDERASQEVRKRFAETKEKLDARWLDFETREREANEKALADEKAAAERQAKLVALRRDIPRALPDLTRYGQLLGEFLEVGAGEPEYSGYKATYDRIGMYSKAAMLSKFVLVNLSPGGESSRQISEFLAGEAGLPDSVWRADLSRASELMSETVGLRRKVMGLMSGNRNELRVYKFRFRRKGTETWTELYSPEPILEKTQDGVTQYWGQVYWCEKDDKRMSLLHTSRVFADKLTTELFEFERRVSPEDNLAAHTVYLRKLIAEANEASAMDIHLLKALGELRTSEEIDTIPAAWLAKRLVHFLYENCHAELPETTYWVDFAKEIDTNVPWINKNHPETRLASEKVAAFWVKMPDFEPIIRRLEANRALLCASLSFGVQCVGSIQPSGDSGGMKLVSCTTSRSDELWVLQASAVNVLPQFKVLSTIGDSIDAESLKRDCFVGMPVFAPSRGRESSKVLRNACPEESLRKRVEFPQSWPVNAR